LAQFQGILRGIPSLLGGQADLLDSEDA
jgi:hypothetical protein